jgi:hypothetical protein
MSLTEGILGHIVRLRPGDVLWVRLPVGTSVENADAIREAIVAALPSNCTIFITEANIVERIESASLLELMQLRELLDRAITTKATTTQIES